MNFQRYFHFKKYRVNLTKSSKRRAQAMRGILLLIALVFLIIAAHSEQHAPAHAAGTQQVSDIEDLWMDLRIGEPLIELFNDAARGDDIARVDHPSQFDQLAGISAGRKMVIFKSVAETAELLPEMAADIDVIGYNLEHGPATPAEEQADPVGSIQAMRELADEYGLLLAFGPDHDFALSHGVEVAPHVDIFVLQIQRQQTNPDVVKEFVEPIVPQLRAENPDLQISVQVRTEGDIQALVDLVAGLEVELDGISILTRPDKVEEAEELVYTLRPEAAPPGFGTYTIYVVLVVAGVTVVTGWIVVRRRGEKTAETQG
ncbi:MAG: hypothetical protein R3293_11055 [Candidatus Promineifilaceae bacterium]|nr:hypothetical protein [Candidatus Promineifilaceae bacterium]